MADAIRTANPDVVFLSEALTECGPCPVNQVEHLARACGLPFVATGENYNVGLPFYRVVGGNAILSRRMLRAEGNPSLAGRQPFFVTHNNRRALFTSLEIGDRRVWLGSLHNDSFDPANRAEQVRQILRYVDDRPCVLAGDFNAEPGSESIKLIQETKRFTGAFDGPPTFPEKGIRIDYVFGPAAWTHVETTVPAGDASDHRAVAATFRLPE
jgi:endonuclease/exonuclease/phosphatase family metal-dependent hydrolase